MVGGTCVLARLAGLPSVAVVVAVSAVALLLPLVLLHFRMRMTTAVDSRTLRLQLHPTGWMIPLPAAMKSNDIKLSDIRSTDVRTHNSLHSSEFWGWHLWGLSAAPGKRYLYGMRPTGLTSLRGVYICLADGGRVMLGSAHPEELIAALNDARSEVG
jgi:hypothetical protein